MSAAPSTSRVKAWRARQIEKARLYDQVEAARLNFLEHQLKGFTIGDYDWDSPTRIEDAFAAAKADPFCFSLLDKAVQV